MPTTHRFKQAARNAAARMAAMGLLRLVGVAVGGLMAIGIAVNLVGRWRDYRSKPVERPPSSTGDHGR